jgi:P-type conjugative transfer protein TrbL
METVRTCFLCLLSVLLVTNAQAAIQLGGLLAGHEADFEAAGASNGVDPKFLEAIAIEETGNGTSHALAAYNNPAGLMNPATPNDTGFFSYATIADGINAEAQNLQANYISAGLISISDIGQKYAPAGALNDPNGTNGGWANDVAGFYQQLGGTSMAMGTAQPTLMGNGVVGAGGTISNVTTPAIVSGILNKFQNAGQKWIGTLEAGATSLFWILATISFSWVCIKAGIRQAGMGEFFGELIRFCFFTGLFFWLLKNGPDFSGKIIASLWQMGGQASGSGNAFYPAQLINIGLQVLQAAMNHISFLQPESIFAPILISLIILIVCALVSVNMILLLCAAWVVLYAGVIFLSFGALEITRDMAVSYFRTALGIGVSLMTLQLIIGLGTSFLQELVTAVGENPEVSQLASVMVAAIILAVLSHQLPKMVAGIATGGSYGAHVGHLGVLTLLGAGFAGARLAAAAAAGPASVAGVAGMSAADKLMARISSAESVTGNGSSRMDSTIPSYTSSPVRQDPPGPTSTPVTMESPVTVAEEEPISDQPIAPEQSRGFQPPEGWSYPDEPV